MRVTKTCTESPHALASAPGEPEVEPSPSCPGAVETAQMLLQGCPIHGVRA